MCSSLLDVTDENILHRVEETENTVRKSDVNNVSIHYDMTGLYDDITDS